MGRGKKWKGDTGSDQDLWSEEVTASKKAVAVVCSKTGCLLFLVIKKPKNIKPQTETLVGLHSVPFDSASNKTV